MTPIGPVSAGGDSVVDHANRRSYPFTLLPTQKQQTFTTPVIGLLPPFARFVQGATVENNKLYEAAIEVYDVTNNYPVPFGPSLVQSNSYNYKMSFDCLMSRIIANPGAFSDATGFMGIELFSQTVAPLVDNPGTAAIHLKWQLKDPTNWMLSTYPGNNVAGTHRSFTIPAANSAAGHKVRLFWDPFELTVSAYVDDVFRVKQSTAGFAFNTLDVVAGILIANGGNVVTSPFIIAWWIGATITQYDMHTSGAGTF